MYSSLARSGLQVVQVRLCGGTVYSVANWVFIARQTSLARTGPHWHANTFLKVELFSVRPCDKVIGVQDKTRHGMLQGS
jgi:hypothetical protein